jgi:acyl-CoA reductase-like NAD-dependent aldehyde dehydrogenase
MAFETRLLIGGEQVPGDGEAFTVENPFTEQPLATVGTPSAEQLDAALDGAREAWRTWRREPAAERADRLHEIATRLRARTDELAEAMTAEVGKPLVESRDEIGWTAAAFDYFAEMGRNFAGRVIPPVESSQLALVVKEPIGVVAAIIPWNFPLLLWAWKVAPALAAGNVVVAKPSERSPLSTLMLGETLDVLPPHVVNLVAGAGDIGSALVNDSRVDCIAFTGSVAVGKRIAREAADRIARIHLELGSKDPFIACADVADDLEIVARAGAWAAYLNAGQVCTSSERFYVQRELYDDFVGAVAKHAESLKLGDPMDPTTDLGPMNSAMQRDKVAEQVDAAVSSGASLVTGGDGGLPSTGYFYAPTVLTDIPADSTLMRDETFGPVVPVMPVSSLQEAIDLANDSPYGLGASVYTRDLANAVHCLRELRAGTVWINDPLTDNDAGPFGGMKQSGLGRELGQEGLEAFQETKHVHIETSIERKEWWYPYSEYSGS